MNLKSLARFNIAKSSYLLLTALVLFAIYLFIQNFLFSSFDLLGLREIDDVAFQLSLFAIHDEIKKFHLDKLLLMNDYGYGWIFWFPQAILTFPLYLIKESFGIEWPLIVLPRQISLIFSFASLYLIYKSLSIYTKNGWTKCSAILLYASSPVFGYYALRFHPTAQVNFFCCLAFYMVAKDEFVTRKSLKYIAVISALAVATKLNGILILPIILLFLADRSRWKINKQNVQNAAFFIAVFLSTFIVFANPLLPFSIFKPVIFTNYLGTMSDSMALVNSNHGVGAGFLSNLLFGIIKSNFSEIIFYSLGILFIIKIVIDFKGASFFRKFDFFYIALSLILVSFYLSKSINLGPNYIASYYSSICFLMIFSLTALEVLEKKIFAPPILIFLFNIYFNFNAIFFRSDFGYSVFYKKAVSGYVLNQIELQKRMQEIVSPPENYSSKLIILQDYKAPVIYTNFKKNVAVYYMFDNIGSIEKLNYDFVVISQENSAFFIKEHFDALVNLSSQNITDSYKINKNIINNLLQHKSLNGIKYSLIFQKGDVLLFKKINSL